MAGLRFWRNTRVASLTSGSTSLGTDTLGYEWDEDIDNGSRPSGLMHLSSTTVSGVEKILDFGETVGIGTATHHLTLYRVASGALVFGAGTVQWAWGLDGNHEPRRRCARPMRCSRRRSTCSPTWARSRVRCRARCRSAGASKSHRYVSRPTIDPSPRRPMAARSAAAIA